MRQTLLLVLALGLSANAALAAETPASGATDSNAAPVAVSGEKESEELRAIMESDDQAQGEIDVWIREDEAFAAKGAGAPGPSLRRRILERMEPVRQAYEDFIRHHPENAKARLAFGSFLYDLDEEDGAREQLERALAGNTNNPAIYNNLANIYSHSGPIEKAFDFYARAMELNPKEGLYPRNLATCMYMFREDAMKRFGIGEQQVFTRALDLYRQALRLDPSNFPLASEVAQTYYGIAPLRTNEALQAWTNALDKARDEIEREGVQIHLARVKILAGVYGEARAHLSFVTNEMYKDLKTRVARNLDQREMQATNSPVAPTNAPARLEK